MDINIRLPNCCILASCMLIFGCSNPKTTYTTWEASGGSKANIRYSTLEKIDSSNIGQLQVAWTYHTGDADTASHSQIQCNPIVIGKIIFGTTPAMHLFALDASTGKEKWNFNPLDSLPANKRMFFGLNNCRGISYWTDGKGDSRIFFTAGSLLHCVDAASGKLVASFGRKGKIDLHDGLDREVKDLYVAATSPGMVYKDLIIMGSRVSEGSDAAPGHIRAYDVRTGQIRWIFHTIPHPGEWGYDSWDDSVAYKNIGGANAWSGFALDEKRGILYAPLGSASFDFYGGMRKGSDLFANCLLALDAATGHRIWHFQTIHHDLWDKDLPTPPALVTLTRDGKSVDAVAQPTKTGLVFLFDRETGDPLFPVEERPVPHVSELNGEKVSPTQPIPVLPKPFVRQVLYDSDINDLLPDSSYQDIKRKLGTYKTGNMFNPPSKEGTVIFPGFDGAAEWGGPAFDPQTGWLYVNANEMPWVLTMIDVKNVVPKKETNLQAGTRLYSQYCMSCHGTNRQGSGNYPSLLKVAGKYNPETFSALVGTGRRMMPAMQQMTKDEKQALASYILYLPALQRTAFVEPPKVLDSFRHLPYTITGYNKFLSKEGYPAVKPPWGTLNAINLNTGQIEWKVPLGEFPEFKAKGIITGTENYGGPIVTANGLLFIAATRDAKFRCFNKKTGKLLWETNLPAAGFATPAMYEADGRQFIVIACGGGKLGTRSGDSYVAFSLPAK